MRRRAPTIREVAQAAGVSISTVSNVLYNKVGYYSPETAQRVWEAVRKLGYRPNHTARSLARQRTYTIGVVVDYFLGGVSSNPYFGTVFDGILQAATDADYHVKIFRVPEGKSEPAVERIEDGSVEGVVTVALTVDNPLLEHLENSYVPTVWAGSIPPNAKIPCVDIDDISATYQAVKWLIELGHRRIAIITGITRQWSARRREQGYLMALWEAGIKPHPAWRYEGNFHVDSGKAGAAYLMGVHPRPTAIVCGNDRIAIGALYVLAEMGIKVPDEVSIIGFDNTEDAAYTEPPLTTINQPMFDIGLKAGEMLLQQIEQGTRFRNNLLLPADLVLRESVAPPPRED